MEQAAPIPHPKDDDDEDVNWALSTATALWGRGERAEALKWLRRAAEQASDANADMRALELFKAAADVANIVSAAPSSAAPPQASSSAARPKPAPAMSAAPEARPAPEPLVQRAPPLPLQRSSATPRPPTRAPEPPRRDSTEPVSSMAMTTPAMTTPAPNVGTSARPDVRASSPAPLRSSNPQVRASDPRASSSSSNTPAPRNNRASAVAVAPSSQRQPARVPPPAPSSSSGEDDLKTSVRSAAEIGALENDPSRGVGPSPLAHSLPGASSRDSSPDEATQLHRLDLLRPALGLRGPSEAIPPAAPASVPETTASPQMNGPSQARMRFDDLDEDTRVLDEALSDYLPAPAPSAPEGRTPIANAALAKTQITDEPSHDALTQSSNARKKAAEPTPLPLPEPKRKSEPKRVKTEPRQKLPSLPAVMVAVVSNGKPGEAKIMVLEPGTMPPEGAAMAILAPMSELDGDALAMLFGMQ